MCYFCGLGEESLVDDDEIRQLKESYAVVFPICKADGKRVYCKMPSNVKKRRVC